MFRRIVCFLVMATALQQASGPARAIAQGDSPDEVAMAAYADAANFQTNGATDLAIAGWRKFLSDYPDHKLVSSASHYLGVCYMQKQEPDYRSAAEAFGVALGDKKYDLREESLANCGWCLYASSGVYGDADPPELDEQRLRQTIAMFKTLMKENPKSRFADRAYFYSGEASYDLGDAKRAVAFYDKLLSTESAAESPLRCEALYSRGVAFEDLGMASKAIGSFRQVIEECGEDALAVDAQLRLGDLLILELDFGDAMVALDQVARSASATDDDRAYARFRRAFALLQSGDASNAAKEYRRVAKDFPDSSYAGAATLASAQSSYRGGDLDAAAEQFQRVLKFKDAAAATEAAHWLARIELTRGKPAAAVAIAKQRITDGLAGDFEVAVRLDLAEGLSMDPATSAESLEMLDRIYRDHRDDSLAPRILYNAAFTALQLGRHPKAVSDSDEFLKRFPESDLRKEVLFVRSEGLLLSGKHAEAAKSYATLVDSAAADDPQRSFWVLRRAAAMNAAGQGKQAAAMLEREVEKFDQPAQEAEARFMIGQGQLSRGESAAAAASFERVPEIAPDWPRSAEALILAGQARLAAGDQTAARKLWDRVADEQAGRRMGDQAEYKLAQLAGAEGDFDQAIKRYDGIVRGDNDPALKPFAIFGKGWALMQDKKYSDAIEVTGSLITGYPNHPLLRDALLTRGICYRNEKRLEEARADLEKFASLGPTGVNLGHALYELALIDQKQDDLPAAVERLRRLVKEVPNYPARDKVLYELGWSLRESGQEAEANRYFEKLIEEFPENPLAAESSYFVGQSYYAKSDWKQSRVFFKSAADLAEDPDLLEKSLYRLGWSHFKLGDYGRAEQAFGAQASKQPDGKLALDALMMVGECRFTEDRHEEAVKAYTAARRLIESNDETAKSIVDEEERQVRELVLLHGGQSSASLKRWDEAIDWYDELRERFPSTAYLPHVYYELGFAYQQKDDFDRAIKLYAQVADNYRNEIAARARFMMGEIHFANRQYDQAIPDFQRVMFGFGAEKAPAEIKRWQARSAFEAGRCGQRLIEQAKTEKSRQKAQELTRGFFRYVVEKHAGDELASKAREQLANL